MCRFGALSYLFCETLFLDFCFLPRSLSTDFKKEKKYLNCSIFVVYKFEYYSNNRLRKLLSSVFCFFYIYNIIICYTCRQSEEKQIRTRTLYRNSFQRLKKNYVPFVFINMVFILSCSVHLTIKTDWGSSNKIDFLVV